MHRSFISSGIRYVLAEPATNCNAGCESVGLKCVANGFDGQDVKKVYESIGQTCKSEEGYVWADQPCIRPQDGHCYGTTGLPEAGIDCAPFLISICAHALSWRHKVHRWADWTQLPHPIPSVKFPINWKLVLTQIWLRIGADAASVIYRLRNPESERLYPVRRWAAGASKSPSEQFFRIEISGRNFLCAHFILLFGNNLASFWHLCPRAREKTQWDSSLAFSVQAHWQGQRSRYVDPLQQNKALKKKLQTFGSHLAPVQPAANYSSSYRNS